MYINVEMEVDTKVLAFMPARWTAIGLPVHDAVVGKILHIDRTKKDKLLKIESVNHAGDLIHIIVSDYRIKQFTFGGIWVQNPKYDPARIEKEDRKKLESEMKK